MTVRLISQGSTSDYHALVRVVDRAREMVDNDEPGTTSYEAFADQDSGRVVWLETFVDADAFLVHVQNLTSSGLIDQMMQVYDIERMTSLTPVSSPAAQEVLEQFGAVQLSPLTG